jgi:ABC-type uncharacterized transport system auxiliary subunit
MRGTFAVLSFALLLAGCSGDTETAATPTSTIALEYSTTDTAAADKAQRVCTAYGRTAQQRPAGQEGAKAGTVTFDCL